MRRLNPFLIAFVGAGCAELLSYLTYFSPASRPWILGAIAAVAAVLAARNLEAVFLALIAEAVIGAHGHLISVQVGGMELTVRMVLFAAVILGWFIRLGRDPGSFRRFLRGPLAAPLAAVMLMTVWGVLRGWQTGRGLGEVIGDGNGYAFLLLVPAALALFSDKGAFSRLTQVFAGAVLWLSVKSLLLLYFFSHDFRFFLPDLYTWQRKFWLTEITRLGDPSTALRAGSGWHRVFSASDLLLIPAVIVGIMQAWNHANRRTIAWLAVVLAAFLLSFSRSFWLGALAGFIWIAAVFIKDRLPGRYWKRLCAVSLAAAGLGALLLGAIVFFPIPTPGVSGLDFGARFGLEDAAVSSRWKMLPPLESGIAASPLLGSGFGTSITYVSDDPRIIALYPGGRITTPAIEWQYLEIWLKTGLLGLAAVIWFMGALGKQIRAGIRAAQGHDRLLGMALFATLIAFVLLNVFTPYLNHPLGWTLLALLAAGAEAIRQDRSAPTKS